MTSAEIANKIMGRLMFENIVFEFNKDEYNTPFIYSYSSSASEHNWDIIFDDYKKIVSLFAHRVRILTFNYNDYEDNEVLDAVINFINTLHKLDMPFSI